MMIGTSLIDANGTANLFISSQMPQLWTQAWQQFSLTAPFLDNSAPPHWPQTLQPGGHSEDKGQAALQGKAIQISISQSL